MLRFRLSDNEGVGSATSAQSTKPLQMPLHQRAVRLLHARTIAAKNALRARLIKSFPLGYEIFFTRGNFDESLFAMITGHRELMHLMGQPALYALVTDHPSMVYRCYRMYLVSSFTKKARRAVLIEHYLYLLNRVSNTFFFEILRNRPRLWQRTVGSNVVAINLSFTGKLQHEGDLLLEFEQNCVPLYHLSCSIAPGYLVGSSVAQVFLIARVQGVAGELDAIRHATKICLDIAPPYLLMAVLQGIAEALHIGLIAGVTNEEQLTANIDASRIVYFDYDDFWRAHLGAESTKFYLMPVPIADKPLALITSGHRRRTRFKRRFKSEVTAISRAAFSRFLTGDARTSVGVRGPSGMPGSDGGIDGLHSTSLD
jgi:uncharacterized protein VirK/YbjX